MSGETAGQLRARVEDLLRIPLDEGGRPFRCIGSNGGQTLISSSLDTARLRVRQGPRSAGTGRP